MSGRSSERAVRQLAAQRVRLDFWALPLTRRSFWHHHRCNHWPHQSAAAAAAANRMTPLTLTMLMIVMVTLQRTSGTSLQGKWHLLVY